jgi:hypothetical protein
MTVTAADRAVAEQVMQAVKDDDVAELAKLLAGIREVAVSCAVIRAEQEFNLTQRTMKPAIRTVRKAGL